MTPTKNSEIWLRTNRTGATCMDLSIEKLGLFREPVWEQAARQPRNGADGLSVDRGKLLRYTPATFAQIQVLREG